MSKAEELMIGDYIMDKFDKTVHRISSIIKQDNGSVFIATEDGHIHQDWMYEFLPLLKIPLVKNGFKPYIPKNHLETVYACQDVSMAVAGELYALWPYQDGSFYLLLRVNGKDMVRMNIHYVHQLQHALRLCGIEKEIIV